MIVFDIETMADTSDQQYTDYKSAKLADKRKSGANLDADKTTKITSDFPLSPLTGKISAVGFMSETNLENLLDQKIDDLEGNGTTYYKIITAKDKDEVELITITLNILTNYIDNGHHLVTYNGSEFDVPFLIRRAMLLGVTKPNYLNVNEIIGRYTPSHIDLFNRLHSYRELQKYKYIPLHEWAYKLNIVNTVKGDDGEQVAVLPFMGMWDELEQHLLEDLVKTTLVYNKVKGWF